MDDTRSKFFVKENSIFGRFAVSSTEIEAGELIHEENPFVVGPKCASKPVCLGLVSSYYSLLPIYYTIFFKFKSATSLQSIDVLCAHGLFVHNVKTCL